MVDKAELKRQKERKKLQEKAVSTMRAIKKIEKSRKQK